MNEKRKIGIMVGSDSDLKQCRKGLEILQEQVDQGMADVKFVITNSIHRNTNDVFKNLEIAVTSGIDVLIVGAGWANHLTGTVDAYLRYTMRNDHIVVIGVPFEDKENPKHTEAAKLSITEVPGTQVVYNHYIGEASFTSACLLATGTSLPEIKLKDPKPVHNRTLGEALKFIKKSKK